MLSHAVAAARRASQHSQALVRRRGVQTPSHSRRTFAARSIADAKIEEIQELYATAKDEFEIASEETEKMSVYAAEDRKAAGEELAKLKAAYAEAVEQTDETVSSEIKGRVGQRVRELENAIEELLKAG